MRVYFVLCSLIRIFAPIKPALTIMEGKPEAIEQLRKAIERTIGKTLETNSDFESLSNSIYEKTRVSISTTTLKRIWGYLSESVTPRRYTLDQLARFIDYDDFDAYCTSLVTDEEPRPQKDSAAEDSPSRTPLPTEEISGAVLSPPSLRWRLWVGILLALAAVALLFFLLRPTTDTSASNGRVLKKGQVFATYDDFLPLFGIDATESRHYQFVPGEEHIIVWSPQYQNPYYHNEGNPDSLMPTITEYFTPKKFEYEDAEAMEKLRQAQKGAYFTVMEKNDMRIVFMKDLVDTSFVFLGVYRFSPVLSDSTKIVWVRATDKCDLDNISFLNNYRN